MHNRDDKLCIVKSLQKLTYGLSEELESQGRNIENTALCHMLVFTNTKWTNISLIKLRRPKTEDRRPKTEGRRSKTENRRIDMIDIVSTSCNFFPRSTGHMHKDLELVFFRTHYSRFLDGRITAQHGLRPSVKSKRYFGFIN